MNVVKQKILKKVNYILILIFILNCYVPPPKRYCEDLGIWILFQLYAMVLIKNKLNSDEEEIKRLESLKDAIILQTILIIEDNNRDCESNDEANIPD
ncbi:MAG: hypothetical protein KatS3mg129_2311 [Leptospiraceae bacterium]|nr:MAG: hypothetical protein KatS3mg129_2311 [Leptospiraceae bacterium]